MAHSQAPSLAHSLFIGMSPRLSEHLLQDDQASYALNKAARSGALEPLNEKKQLSSGNSNSLLVRDCCFVEFEECAVFADGDQLCEEVYATGLQEFPVEGRFQGNCELTWRRLGIPCPSQPVSVSAPGGEVNEKFSPRSYAYSFVNSAGREGQLSLPSEIVIVEDGQCVSVSGWEQPSEEWDVESVRIYRTVSGTLSDFAAKVSRFGVNEKDTAWMLVGEANLFANTFQDCRPDEELTEAAMVELLPPPPPWLIGIVNLGAQNVLAGFVGKTIYFSKNNNFDAWPHWFTLEDNIRAIVPSGGKLYVSTDGHPYVIEGITDCQHAGLRTVVRAIESSPAANCSPRAIAAVPGGAIYPAVDGLTFIGSDGRTANVLDQHYSLEDWLKLLPDTMLPAWYQGHIYLFGRYKSLRFASAATKNMQWKFDGLTELSDIAVRQVVITQDDRMILLEDTGVYEWEADRQNKRVYLWRSKIYHYASSVGFKPVQIWLNENGQVIIRVFADGRKVFERGVVRSQRMYLPTWAFGKDWYYELEGVGTVGKFSMANLEVALR